VFGDNFGNPRVLPNVETCLLQGKLHALHPELTHVIEKIAPTIVVGIGSLAAALMKWAYPTSRLIFLAVGCQQMKQLIIRGEVQDYLAEREILARSRGWPRVYADEEQEAVECADLIVANSELVRSLYCWFFSPYEGKIWPEVIWFAEWIFGEARRYAHLRRPFPERDIDVLFIASSWSRPEKNYRLVRRITARLGRARVHIVGDVEAPTPGAVHHGLIADRASLFGLLGRARTVVCPSAFDAAPGILYEASAMGCNVVASPNCGNAQLCHPELLVGSRDPRAYARAIAASLKRKYDDQAEALLSTASTRRLVELLAVL
jgi:glycosyltransferase involved in cell wall biosynthesis